MRGARMIPAGIYVKLLPEALSFTGTSGGLEETFYEIPIPHSVHPAILPFISLRFIVSIDTDSD